MRRKVQARNALEGYCVNIKHTLSDSKLEGKISPDEKETILNKIKQVESWISSNHNADAE